MPACCGTTLWREGADEVAAAFHLYLTTVCRDAKNVVIWLDNCAVSSMAADATHHAISKNLRRNGVDDDFADYVAATTAAGPRSIRMEPRINMIVTED